MQSAFTIATPVSPERAGDLERLLDEVGSDVAGNPRLRLADLPDLHYASLVVVAGGRPPYLLFEGNIDGPIKAFLEHLLDTSADGVDAIYRCCVGYPPGRARHDVLAYLQAHDIGADTFYVNRPGRAVEDIRGEQRLHDHLQQVLDGMPDADLRRLEPEALRQELGRSLPPDLAWARQPAPVPFLVRHSLDAKVVFAIVLAPVAVGLVGLLASASRSSSPRRAATSKVALLAIAALAGGTAQRLRAEERADERKDALREPDWEAAYASRSGDEEALGSREDLAGQNHMASITRVKDGWFRYVVLRVVLWVLNVVARVTANRGTLGGITSIHFARWVITPDRSLVFLSNFDGSWESYLNDFIDLGAFGLSAVWSNTDTDVGFPATRWLVKGGARVADRFKAYARSSMVPAGVWYSAYPTISASNIGNNMRIREGLFAPPDPAATEAWLRRL